MKWALVSAAEHNGPDDKSVDTYMQMIDAALDEGQRGKRNEKPPGQREAL